jgi:hypothetical protein
MVFLRDLKNQWPWVNSQVNDFSDKELAIAVYLESKRRDKDYFISVIKEMTGISFEDASTLYSDIQFIESEGVILDYFLALMKAYN